MKTYSTSDLSAALSKRVCLLFMTLFAVAGCATIPESTTLPMAKLSLESIHEDKLNKYAPLELKIARDNVVEAEQAAKEKRHDQAERLAQKALVNIKLAEAKAEMKKSEITAKQMEQNIRSLRDEIQRK